MNHLETVFKAIPPLLKGYSLLIGLLIILFIASNTSLNLPLLAVSLLVTYKLSLLLLTKKIASSRIFVAIIAVFFYVLLLQSVSLTTWLIARDFPLSMNIFVTLLVTTAVYIPLRRLHKPSERKNVEISDYISISIAILALLLCVGLPIRNTGLHNESGLLVLANYNVDDGSHLGLINARLQYNVATTDGNKADISSRVPGGISYPSGWPAANAAIIQAFHPSIKVGASTLIAYVIIKIFWLFFLILIFIRSVFALYGIFSPKPLEPATSIWISLCSLTFTGWFLLDPFFYGFFSFIPQLITVPLFIVSVMQLTSLKKNGTLPLYLMLPSILCIGAALSWFLLFPVFTIALLLSLLRQTTGFNLKDTIQEISKNIFHYLIFYLVITFSLLAQLYMVISSSHTGVSSSFINSLLLNGGINIYPVSFYTSILFGTIIFFTLGAIKKNIGKLGVILNYIVAMLTFSGFVYIVQLYKLQENVYYYFKILNTVTIVGIILAIIGGALLVNKIQEKTTQYIAITSSIIISLLLFQFGYQGTPLFGYIRGTRSVSSGVDQQIFTTLKQRETTSRYSDGVVTIFYPSNNPILNEVASTLVEASKVYTPCYSTLKGASFSTPIKNFTVTPILQGCTPDDQIVYYVDPPFVQSTRQTISEHGLQNRVTVYPIAQ